MYIIYMAKW